MEVMNDQTAEELYDLRTNQTIEELSDPTSNNQMNPSIKRKVKKPGVIYLNYIPRYMTVKKVREHFSEFGEVRRMFLKPERSKKPGKPSKFFCEGWVEFAEKKIAKQVSDCLNGAQVGGKRRTPYYDALWSIKYLAKFQWSQLNERQAYKKAQKGLRMRAEIAQAKREVNFYTRGAEKGKHMKKRNNVGENKEETSNVTFSALCEKETKELSEDKCTDEKNILIMKNILI